MLIFSVFHRWLHKPNCFIFDTTIISPSLSPYDCAARFFSLLILYTVGRTLWTGNQPVQGRYLHTEQHKHRTNTHRHRCLEWNPNPRPQCWSGWRRFTPYTARPLWSPGTNIFTIVHVSWQRRWICRVIACG
jgi:hypothetical protein